MSAGLQAAALMPMPTKEEPGTGELVIGSNFRVSVCGRQEPLLTRAITRFTAHLQTATGIPIPAPPSTSDCAQATLAIEYTKVIDTPALGDDESYKLEVTSKNAHLRAATSTGVLRGLATFEQLVQAGTNGFSAQAVTIEDQPRFAWRGLMIDAARHFMPVEVIERNLDAMAFVKLNVFHWHLSDDQGFRVESLVYPKLHGEGSDGLYYTQQQVLRIVRMAADRGIRVVPEFDMPAHTTAWFVGYPELASAPGPYQIERKWGVLKPVMDPTKESTYVFLDRLIREMSDLFPDAYFHTGGDEAVDAQWKANPAIQQFMRAHDIKTTVALQTYFSGRVEGLVEKHGKKMVGWDEILSPGLPKTAVVQSWRGPDGLADAARQGYDVLLSNGYYLDHMSPAAKHYANDPFGGKGDSLSPEQRQHILGGEACMWSEYVSAETVDSRIWPRMAAVAERLWSRASQVDEASMYARLNVIDRELEWTGVRHRATQPEMLARIAGGQPDAALTVLANSVEAQGLDGRYHTHKYTSMMPLNRLVDAAVADNEYIRRLEAYARLAVTGNAQARDALRVAFAQWKTSSADMAPIVAKSAIATDIAPIARVLSTLGDIGLKTLPYLEKNQKPAAKWLADQRALVTASLKPVSEVRVSAADVIRILLDAIN